VKSLLPAAISTISAAKDGTVRTAAAARVKSVRFIKVSSLGVVPVGTLLMDHEFVVEVMKDYV
jgi:hypothetical protein